MSETTVEKRRGYVSCRTLLLAGVGGLTMALSAASGFGQAGEGLTVLVKPVPVGDGTVAAFEVQELVRAGTKDGAPLSLKAALSAIAVKHIADSITGLQVTDAKGDIGLTTTDDPPVESDDSAYRHWKATRPVNLPVSIRYRIPAQPLLQHGPPLDMVAAGKGVAGNGIGFLLLPENTTSTATRMRWDLSAMPEGSVGVITAGPGEVVLAGPPSELAKQWVLAGPAVVVSADKSAAFHGYLVGTPPFEGRQVLEWSEKAYGVLGRYFGYLGLPKYNLMVRALNGESFGTGTAGEGRGGSMISVGKTFWPGQDEGYMYVTIFHEMTHQWVGLIKGRASWFEEGLTVFTTDTLRCEAPELKQSDCAKDINYNTASYYTSVARNWSQQKISDTPFAQESVREVPYGRGALYFANLNAELLAKSHGRRGLKDVLYPLFVARNEGKGFDQADWEAMLRRELGPEAVTEFHDEVIEGTKEIVPPPDAFGPCLTRSSVMLKPKDGRSPVQAFEWHPIVEGAPAGCAKP